MDLKLLKQAGGLGNFLAIIDALILTNKMLVPSS